MPKSEAFHLLDERIQRFIWEAGWTDLHEIQEQAIPIITRGADDVILAAATAEGKTEAAFFPALTVGLHRPLLPLIIYVGPLKALINDQFQRLSQLCERLDIPVHPWHGDIGSRTKARFLKQPEGVLLITPESLEATLCNRGALVGHIFEHALFFIIDELHAFIGTERGMQLISQLHRIETVLGRKVRRIGLSATLGDMNAAARFMRSESNGAVQVLVSDGTSRELKVLIKGYQEPLAKAIDVNTETPVDDIAPSAITEHMYRVLRGSNNLVFPNSRKSVEWYTHRLSSMCKDRGVPNEFWPHHGSLSKEIRLEAEAALKSGEYPATGICTNTLELGIDIGAVKSIAQVGSPPSVASLRQRLGRSGRRKGEPAILWGYQIENEIGPSCPIHTQLRMGTVQTAAMVSLLADKWFEPPVVHGKHCSTLVQQVLSFIAQNGGATASQCYNLFCSKGAPFQSIIPDDFASLLRYLGENDLIIQDKTGVFFHGAKGERIVNHYSFYAAFATDEEYRIITGQKTLGSIPISVMLVPGQFILFAGRTWRITEVEDDSRTIHVVHAGGGVPPPFAGGSGRIHSMIRRRMRVLYEGTEPISFFDSVANQHLSQGRETYSRMLLSNRHWTEHGSELILWTWLGDEVNEALAALLKYGSIPAQSEGAYVSIHRGAMPLITVFDQIRRISDQEIPNTDDLLHNAKGLRREKWDWALPDSLMRQSYASLNLDLPAAHEWLIEHDFSI
ncbi:MAG TPA: DEAD/DEAH box helicase [Flavobacteriales bacterium]|nr:DEAD/DEAH box helicase [Flavobacteriales bacterium]